jgi:hypothetical protein
MVPLNEPEEMPVAAFRSRTPLKLPVAPSNRPVPPVMMNESSDRKDIGFGRGRHLSAACAEESIAVCRDEDVVPHSGSRNKVDQRRESHRVSSEVRRGSHGRPSDDEGGGRLRLACFSLLIRATERYFGPWVGLGQLGCCRCR